MTGHGDTQWRPLEPPPDITRYGFYVGTSGYYYDDWIGRFNPPRLTPARRRAATGEEIADRDRLRFYQKYFSFVEINNTFYRPPMPASFLDIERRSRESTMYTVKVHRDISHTRELDTKRGVELMRAHAAAVHPLVETGRFYSFLIQLEDHRYRSTKMLDYLCAVGAEAVSRGVDVHIEFRHNSWHDLDALQRLKDSGIGICNTEIPPVRHAFPLKAYATSDKGYVRYSGLNLANWYPTKKGGTARERVAQRNARYDYSYSDAEIEERARGQIELARKVSQVAVAYNNHYQIQAVRNALRNITLLRAWLEEERKKTP